VAPAALPDSAVPDEPVPVPEQIATTEVVDPPQPTDE
jgi:hypothetical protein